MARILLLLITVWLVVSCAGKDRSDPMADWALYKSRFVSTEGRVIDTGNGDISHSEGQGFAMLLAEHFADQPTFDAIWSWTQQQLQIRGDHLFAWKWTPQGDAGVVSDRNNSADGDLLIAWALYRAARQWNQPAYQEQAAAIAGNLRELLVRPSSQGPILLPGEQGFVKENGVIVNLSYWVFPAFQAMNEIDPAPEWQQLTQSGLNLLAMARFGRWQLPPDWMLLSDQASLATEFKPQFGYNAVRIPLYLVWAKLDTPENLKVFADFWGHFDGAKFTPAWTNLNDNSIDSYDASSGIEAIIHMVKERVKRRPVRALPALDDQQDYYSSSLLLLTRLAITESASE